MLDMESALLRMGLVDIAIEGAYHAADTGDLEALNLSVDLIKMAYDDCKGHLWNAYKDLFKQEYGRAYGKEA